MDLYIRASEIKNNYNLILYRNRNESTFNVCMVTFSDHDDGTYFLGMMMSFNSRKNNWLISTKTRNTSGKRKQRKMRWVN